MAPAADAQPLACYFSDAVQDQKREPADTRLFVSAARGSSRLASASAPGHLRGLDSPERQEEVVRGTYETVKKDRKQTSAKATQN